MAAFTSKATGNWSSGGQTTWNEAGVPGSGDTVTIASGHTVTVDVNTTSGGITMNGPLTVAAGVTLTLAGNCTQGDATFTLAGAGSALCFDTTAANRKWLIGTANSQTNCKIVCNGTANGGDTTGLPPATMGTNHARIYKTGSNYAWFDESSEGAGTYVNNGGWECTYTDFEDLGHNTADWSIRSTDYGAHHRRFYYCTFDNCKQQFAVVFGWDGNANKDWRVEYCRWINQPTGAASAAIGMRYVFPTAGTGVRTFKFNSVGDPGDKNYSMTLGAAATVEDCYFDSAPYMTGLSGCIPVRCTLRISTRLHGYSPGLAGGTTGPFYFLADHVDPSDRYFGTTDVGNQHYHEVYGTGTFDGIVLEYPHELLIDQADGFYGREDATFRNATIQNCLVIPSMTDDHVASNCHPMIHGNNRIKMYHNTIAGKTAQLVYNERDYTNDADPRCSGRTGTAQAGGASTITLDAGASATDDRYTDHRIFITGGTGSGQRREITDYVGATKVATVSVAWTTVPDATSTFAVTEVPILECKSNLIAGISQSGIEWGAIGYDLSGETVNQIDTITPEGTTHNYSFQPVPANPSIPGSVDGMRLRLSTTLPTSNIFDYSAGPQFVDATRNVARWARYKGVVGVEPERPALPVSYSAPAWQTWLTWKRDAIDAARVLLMADPTLGQLDLMPWVKAGFRPNNPALNFAAHDGTTIGSEQYVSPAGGSTGALGGEGAVQKVSRPSSFSPGAYC